VGDGMRQAIFDPEEAEIVRSVPVRAMVGVRR